jgi:hypothetical protein
MMAPTWAMKLISLSNEGLGVAVIFAGSVCLAICRASYIPAKVATVSQKEPAAIPVTMGTRFDDTDWSANDQQTNPPTPPPEAPQSSPPDNLLVRQRIGNAPPGFRNLLWGSSPTTALVKVSGPFGPNKVAIWIGTSTKLAPVFGAPVTQESYFFRNGALYGGEMIFDGLDNFQKIKDGITKIFGPPDFVDEASKVFEWDWHTPDIDLRISYKEASHRGTLHLARK